MAFDFPNSPTLGQAYGNYLWDGEKWTLPNLVDAIAARKSIYAAPLDAMAYNGMQINGSMDVSQELGGTAVSIAGKYVCDGWLLYTGGTMAVAAAQGASVGSFAGIPNILYCTVGTAQASLSGGDQVCFYQIIEGRRIARLAWGSASAQPITIGFWTAHHRAGLYSGTVRNSSGARSYAFTYTQATADGPQYNVVTIPGDTTGTWNIDNTGGILVTFAMASGATLTAPSANAWLAGNYIAGPGQINGVAATSDVFRITGVVVLPGIEAPSAARSALIMRPYDQELLTCQRYWEKSYDPGTAPGAAAGNPYDLTIVAAVANAAYVFSTVKFIASKRAAPTVVLYSPTTGGTSLVNVSGVARSAVAADVHVSRFGALQNQSGSPFNVGEPLQLHYTADARL